MKEYNITFDEGGKNERTMTFRYVPSKQQVQNMSGNFAYETTAKENFKVRISEVQADNRPNGEGELEKYVYDVKTGQQRKHDKSDFHCNSMSFYYKKQMI